MSDNDEKKQLAKVPSSIPTTQSPHQNPPTSTPETTQAPNVVDTKPVEGRKSVVVAASQSFSGPLPPPAYLAEYERALPGASDRLFRLLENETKHRMECDLADRNLQMRLVENEKQKIDNEAAKSLRADTLDHKKADYANANFRRGQWMIFVAIILCLSGMGLASIFNQQLLLKVFGGLTGAGALVSTVVWLVKKYLLSKNEPVNDERPGKSKGLSNSAETGEQEK